MYVFCYCQVLGFAILLRASFFGKNFAGAALYEIDEKRGSSVTASPIDNKDGVFSPLVSEGYILWSPGVRLHR